VQKLLQKLPLEAERASMMTEVDTDLLNEGLLLLLYCSVY